MKTGKGAGATGGQVAVSAQVVSVDPADNTITLKRPKGGVETVNVQDPDNQAKLSSIKPGQVMQFIYTEAMAVSVTPEGCEVATVATPTRASGALARNFQYG